MSWVNKDNASLQNQDVRLKVVKSIKQKKQQPLQLLFLTNMKTIPKIKVYALRS